jgi:hypothetical protein
LPAAPNVLGVECGVVLDRHGERDEAGIGLAGERRPGDGLALFLGSHEERGS